MDGTSELKVRHKLTVDDVYRMAEAGILAEDDRIEIIDGEIIDMAAIGTGHASVVNRINSALTAAFGATAIVSVQNPVRLDDHNQPQPDFAVLKPRPDFYSERHPRAVDVLLLVEVADTSLRYDRAVKLPVYARAGIAEVWIVDLQHRVIDAHRLPTAEGFAQNTAHRAGHTLRLAARSDIVMTVDDLLG